MESYRQHDFKDSIITRNATNPPTIHKPYRAIDISACITRQEQSHTGHVLMDKTRELVKNGYIVKAYLWCANSAQRDSGRKDMRVKFDARRWIGRHCYQ